MTPHPLAETIAAAVIKRGQALKLAEKLKALTAEIDELDALIVAHAGPLAVEDEKGTRRAEIATESGTAKLVWPVPSLKLTEDNFDAAKELAGPAFAKIAEKIPVTHKLLKAARDLIPALLPKAAAEKLVKLLSAEPAAPRITFS